MTLRDGYRHLRFAIRQVESLPERFDGRIVDLIRIADENDAARELIGTVRGPNRLHWNRDQQERPQIITAADCQDTLRSLRDCSFDQFAQGPGICRTLSGKPGGG
jgi:hypothetical protein